MLPLDVLRLYENIEVELSLGFLTFLRVAPIFIFFPALSERFIPRRILLAFIVFFSFALSPTTVDGMNYFKLTRAELLFLAASETLLGVFLGFFIRSIIYKVQVAGSAISSMSSISQMFQSGAEAMPALSQLIMYSALALFISGDLHLTALMLISDMYNFVPIGSFSCMSCIADAATSVANSVFNGGITLATGVISLLFVFYLFSGFVNKAMPQFMVTFVFAPFAILMTMYFLSDHLILILQVWLETSREFLQMNHPLGTK